MRLRFATGLAIAWFGVATSAAAEAHSPRRYEAALRLGYSAGSALGVRGFTFLGLDLGYHLSPRWSAGPYAEVGFIDSVEHQQAGPVTFLGHHYRFGAQLFAQLLPQGLIDPWWGAGVGYAALGVDAHSDVLPLAAASVVDYRGDRARLRVAQPTMRSESEPRRRRSRSGLSRASRWLTICHSTVRPASRTRRCALG